MGPRVRQLPQDLEQERQQETGLLVQREAAQVAQRPVARLESNA